MDGGLSGGGTQPGLPRLQVVPPPPATAWSAAFEEASLLSPLASARSFSSKLSPAVCEEMRRSEVAAEAASRWAAAKREATTLSALALPISITNLAAFAISLVTLSVVGRLGSFEMSAAVLATVLYNVSGLSLLLGFASAMETFCGQAYGAGNYRLVGVVLQRAMILTTLLSACVAALWRQAEPLLLFFRQDPLLSRSAARYILLLSPALLAQATFEVFKRYLMAQGVVRPATWVTLAGLALSPAYAYYFVFYMDWRLDGAAIGVSATQITMAALLGCYTAVRDRALRGQPTATWHGWSSEALRGWPTYLRFALPSVVMICCEWWTFEVMILMSGWMPNPDVAVATMGVTINTSGIIWMWVTGYAMALSTRVSNSLGAGFPRVARRATWVAVYIALALEGSAMVAILLLRHSWAHLFTDAEPVVLLTASVLPVFALTLPGDGCNAALQGLLRGSGRQGTGAVTNLCSYWILGIPAAYFLAFRMHLGMHGLWWGLVIVNTVQGLVMTAIAWRFNFSKEAAKALARAAARSGTGTADGSLRQPLLEGQQCERLEAGMLLDPSGPGGEEEQQQQQQQQQAARVPADAVQADAEAGAQRGRQRAATDGEEPASPKEELR
ncbi:DETOXIFICATION 16-like [Chlorella sorokiniana]|uniref:Protein DETOXIFICATION n=1 Tax=Chlorella sorokiniana TaxID=3076 RepID=A0A2P6TRU0_CHLSO|nr:DETOXIFICATION 16-like [Chlorella sorokiniana]|eukprot:PRW56780.1 DETOXIFICATION 16-like [Chlorella sorokiniana]